MSELASVSTVVRARGRLAHHFHGEYSATIALVFDAAEDATEALRTLSLRMPAAEWTQPTSTGLVCTVGATELREFVLPQLLPLVTDIDKHPITGKPMTIDSLDASVDRGPEFRVVVPTTSMRQMALFSGDAPGNVGA